VSVKSRLAACCRHTPHHSLPPTHTPRCRHTGESACTARVRGVLHVPVLTTAAAAVLRVLRSDVDATVASAAPRHSAQSASLMTKHGVHMAIYAAHRCARVPRIGRCVYVSLTRCRTLSRLLLLCLGLLELRTLPPAHTRTQVSRVPHKRRGC
jgi:hypothetical protein